MEKLYGPVTALLVTTVVTTWATYAKSYLGWSGPKLHLTILLFNLGLFTLYLLGFEYVPGGTWQTILQFVLADLCWTTLCWWSVIGATEKIGQPVATRLGAARR